MGWPVFPRPNKLALNKPNRRSSRGRHTEEIRATRTHDPKWSGRIRLGVNGHKTRPNTREQMDKYLFFVCFRPIPGPTLGRVFVKTNTREACPCPPVARPWGTQATLFLHPPPSRPNLPEPYPAMAAAGPLPFSWPPPCPARRLLLLPPTPTAYPLGLCLGRVIVQPSCQISAYLAA